MTLWAGCCFSNFFKMQLVLQTQSIFHPCTLYLNSNNVICCKKGLQTTGQVPFSIKPGTEPSPFPYSTMNFLIYCHQLGAKKPLWQNLIKERKIAMTDRMLFQNWPQFRSLFLGRVQCEKGNLCFTPFRGALFYLSRQAYRVQRRGQMMGMKGV